MKTTLSYSLIGSLPAGIENKNHSCEFISMETKRNRKGQLETIIKLKILKKELKKG